MKFYKRDPDAALSGMSGLTMQERGAYNTIIDLLYSRDGVVPDDDDMIRRVQGCHGNEWRAVKAKLIAKGKIWVKDGFLKAKRVDSVLHEAEDFSETQRVRVENRWEIEGKPPGNRGETARKPPGNRAQKQKFNSEINQPSLPYTPTPTPKVRPDLRSGAGAPVEHPDPDPGGEAPKDFRKELFGRGLRALAAMTGKTPDSCRSLVGKWLKAVDDEAVHVLAAIDDAGQNQIADPVPWIMRKLGNRGGRNGSDRSVVVEATPFFGIAGGAGTSTRRHRSDTNGDAIVAGMARVARKMERGLG